MGLSGGLRARSSGWAGDHEQVALAQTEPQRSQRQHSQRAVERESGRVRSMDSCEGRYRRQATTVIFTKEPPE